MEQGLFSPAERAGVLRTLIHSLRADERIAGVVIVGSAAEGFDDRHSDIDLSVVAEHRDDVEPVFHEWGDRVSAILPVVHRFEARYAADSLLFGFLLENFLEIDMGFLWLGNLVAKRSRWEVAFDRSGEIRDVMARTWETRSTWPCPATCSGLP